MLISIRLQAHEASLSQSLCGAAKNIKTIQLRLRKKSYNPATPKWQTMLQFLGVL
jgi:hypothetical protein|tara:strand:+ start:303 stop:467 length:165 start_codon:yes stop_codon:yes gene_type:complete